MPCIVMRRVHVHMLFGHVRALSLDVRGGGGSDRFSFTSNFFNEALPKEPPAYRCGSFYSPIHKCGLNGGVISLYRAFQVVPDEPVWKL